MKQAQPIHIGMARNIMTKEQTKLIRDMILANREFINRLHLQNQTLNALLPTEKGRKGHDPEKGYITLPDGEKLWFDKKEEKKYNRAKSSLTLKVTKKQEARQC
jgi:hypothetical protein